MPCIFCKIINGEIPSKKLYEDETVLAFHDISPQSNVHFLVIPKTHISGADQITHENSGVVAHIFEVIAKLTVSETDGNGFRVITNCGQNGCQSVDHLHFHVMANRQLVPLMG